MVRSIQIILILFLTIFSGCQDREGTGSQRLISLVENLEKIEGTADYLESPYVTAGDRVYQVGHQDGSFPDLGWHVTGEMGGIWDHPIKLMDGFRVDLLIDGDTSCLSKADKFINYPVANQHSYKTGLLDITRVQFIPDGKEGVIVEFTIANKGADVTLDFIFTGHVDLMPVWLSEREGIVDGKDDARYNEENQAFIAKDQLNEWYVAFGADRRPDYYGDWGNYCKIERRGKGIDGALTFTMDIGSGQNETVTFFIAGSYNNLGEAWSTFTGLKADPVGLLEKKINRYRSLSGRSLLEIEDKALEQTYRWIKYNTAWLIRDVPEVGRGLSAGIPDYPWWFGADNAYSIQGLLATGMHDEALNTIDLVMKLSRDVNHSNGRIMHEASTNGVVFNPGNLNETPHFIHTLWKAYEWTGDQSLIDKYYEDVKKAIEWIEGEDKDGNGYPDGPGMMEIHGLHTEMIDVVVYLQKGYEAAANFASVKGETNLARSYRKKAGELANRINDEWWVEEFQSFADFRSTRDQALELIEAAMIRADTINKPWSREELEETLRKTSEELANDISGYVVHHNWVVNTPLEMNVADADKAQKALTTARNYTNRFGIYVTGMDRDERQEKAEKWKAFSYVGAVMTLPTGVQAIAEANYGNPDAALEYLKMLENSFSYALPGSMYEVSPDYGMIAQAWNIYAVATPVVEHFFGIKPKAYEKEILIEPKMPLAWKESELSNVVIGDNSVTIRKSNENGRDVYHIFQEKNDWKIFFKVMGTAALLNGAEVAGIEDVVDVNFSGLENRIEIFK